MTPRHQRGTCWRTNRHGVGIGKTHTFAGELIEMRRLKQVRTIATKVHPTKVIGKNENDVRSLCGD
jgi:hypothetical protein